MNAKKRYTLIFLISVVFCSAFIVFRKSNRVWRRSTRRNSWHNREIQVDQQRLCFLDEEDEFKLHDKVGFRHERAAATRTTCTMETCFDRTKCLSDFKVYVYPTQPGEKISPLYGKILKVLKESIFYTDDPKKACLFIPSVDTLDRDNLSEDYVHDLPHKIVSLPHWNGGTNHIIFSLFSGTWPDYSEDLRLDTGKAILAKASLSTDFYRLGFDVSFPLFLKSHPPKGNAIDTPSNCAVFPLDRKYKLAFKGKRYLSGIGSESRNSFYHIHNGKDIVLLTTCKHGKNWRKNMDERCEKDNEEYDKYDYEELLKNATFCLAPRGRRLGSYRFLESLQAGCIPVLLSNGWELPFSEVIDWSKALIQGDERLLTEIPSVVRSYGKEEILAMKQQTLFLWEAYFSSIEKILFTTLEVIRMRLFPNKAVLKPLWNTFPGALVMRPQYSMDPKDFPFFYSKLGIVEEKFTAVIYSTTSVLKDSSALSRLIKNVGKSKFIAKIIVLWTADVPFAHSRKWPQVGVPLVIVRPESKTGNSRFVPRAVIETSAVLSLDEDIILNSDAIDFAFSTWRTFPDRIVGFAARSHYWNSARSQWSYSSILSDQFSIILTNGAFYHRYYNYLYTHNLPPRVHRMVEHHGTCEDLAMNFLVADITRKPPIKVLTQQKFQDLNSANTRYSKLVQLFEQRQRCMESLVDIFGYMPLVKSYVRMDPSLHKDPVSNLRKQYRLLE
ncbi:unnamed protein product [Pocillopora meandrina]|uniref:Uncharacterized protein n=1 Tax=Pocillopora meandrina TaxID=46732 RepID=A0AAU9XL06_9CNID|nr:unnamed protein product [Pocillopora meandrina]